MKFSLVMATLGRVEEVELFMKSLILQDYPNHELIIVDQNEHHLLEELVQKYEDALTIKYIRSDRKGLSYNRNVGIRQATGDILGFPDDDCEYPDHFLMEVNSFFETDTKYQFYSCNTKDKNKDYGMCRMLDYDCDVTAYNAVPTIFSSSLFVKCSQENRHFFDPMLGVGAKFGSGEEPDYARSLIYNGLKGRYFANTKVYHPAKLDEYQDPERTFKYALGFGAQFKKEIVYRRNYLMFPKFLFHIATNLWGVLFKKKKIIYWHALKGRLIGFVDYKIHSDANI